MPDFRSWESCAKAEEMVLEVAGVAEVEEDAGLLG